MREGPFTKLTGRQWRLTPAQHRTLQKAADWGRVNEYSGKRIIRTLELLEKHALLERITTHRSTGVRDYRITPLGRQVLEAPAAWGLTTAQIDAYNRRHPRAR